MTPDTLNPEHPALPAEERMRRNKALLLEALKGLGAVRATVTYSGGGDEGAADETSAVDADGRTVDLSTTVDVFTECTRYADQQWHTWTELDDELLHQALSDFAMEAVESRHEGWYDGEGGSGQVVFDCASDTVRIEHAEYRTESDFTETEL